MAIPRVVKTVIISLNHEEAGYRVKTRLCFLSSLEDLEIVIFREFKIMVVKGR